MMWDLPIDADIDGKKYAIRNKCDYRVVLDAICALNDIDLAEQERLQCALFIFYEKANEIEDLKTAIEFMFKIINGGEEFDESQNQKPKLMDWEHDFSQLAPPISRVLGYDVRTPERYCHFWTFLGAYNEIGECAFSTIVSIRAKRAKSKKLEKWEEEYLREHRKLIELPQKLTADEQEFLNSDW